MLSAPGERFWLVRDGKGSGPVKAERVTVGTGLDAGSQFPVPDGAAVTADLGDAADGPVLALATAPSGQPGVRVGESGDDPREGEPAATVMASGAAHGGVCGARAAASGGPRLAGRCGRRGHRRAAPGPAPASPRTAASKADLGRARRQPGWHRGAPARPAGRTPQAAPGARRGDRGRALPRRRRGEHPAGRAARRSRSCSTTARPTA